MRRHLPYRYLWLTLCLLLATACSKDEGKPSDDDPERGTASGTLTGAEAMSAHYVRLTFSSSPPAEALDATRYTITDDAGGNLPILFAQADGANEIILATEQQAEVRYRASFDAPREVPKPQATSTNGISGQTQGLLNHVVEFRGSIFGEAYVKSATAISNTEVLVAFSARVGSGATLPGSYLMQPQLGVVSAELSKDAQVVLLTTTSQEAIEYGLRVVAVETSTIGKDKILLDPTRTRVTFQGLPAVDTSAPRLVSAVATGSTTVLLTFNEALSSDAANPIFYSVSPSMTITGGELALWNTQVVLRTLPLSAGVTYTVNVTAGVKDRARISIAPPNNSATFSAPTLSDPNVLPRVVGAVSTSNTTVIVRYSRPMNAQAVQASNYSVVQENVQSEAGALLVESARFVDAAESTVELTTRSQNELLYRVRVSNVADKVGNPLAPAVTSSGVLVDPTSATFAGSPPGAAGIVDSDGDGVPDNVEQSGWTIAVVLTNGTIVETEVTADPDAIDTDEDGLSDAIERLQGSNPRSGDTDGDGLSDNEEYNIILSNPNTQDTDGDTIDDFLEVTWFKTNCLVADSDGDGYRDDDELFVRQRDARVADLPSHELTIGNVSLVLDERYTYTDENGQSKSETSSTSTQLSTGNSSRTLSSGTFSVGVTAGIDNCQENGSCDYYKRLKFLVEAVGGASFENESVNEASKAFERSLEKGSEISSGRAVTREVVGAKVAIDFTLTNTSDVAFSMGSLEVSVQVQAPDDPAQLIPLATLVPESTLQTGKDLVLTVGPRQIRGPIHMVSRDVFPAVVEDLLRAPRGLVFKVSNFDLISEDQRNFAFGLQTVRERTVGVLIDSGEGSVKQYQAITAGVLNRPREELRCATTGPRANALCTSDADCAGSTPCQGGTIVGGFSGFDGTGRNAGVPFDFVLQDALQMPRSRPPVLLAGANGVANSVAVGDDVQVVPVGTSGLAASALVVGPGHNLVLDTPAGGDDVNPTPYDGIKAGSNKRVDSIATGDDVQVVPAGTTGVVEDTVVVTAGENGVLDTPLRGDDRSDVVTGYEVSSTCDANTPAAILAGIDRRADSTVAEGRCSVVPSNLGLVVGDPCRTDADCGNNASPGAVGVCHTDVQAAAVGSTLASATSAVIRAGAGGFVNSVPAKTDVYLGPGVPCTSNLDCAAGALGAGQCAGPQKIVRVGARRDGDYRRFWALTVSDDVQFQTDLGSMHVRSGDVIGLKFIQDLDRDGLSSEVEFLAGSSDFAVDTDLDGLGDFSEIRVGWTVGAVGQSLRHVYSDPRLRDSDRDGLSDLEEADLRPLQCACNAGGPENLVVGDPGDPCSSSQQCAQGAACLSMVACTPSDVQSGLDCPVCPSDPTQNRTDPRRSDTDSDRVPDFDEVLGYLTGAGILDVGRAQVILAGSDLKADTRACPQNHCDESLSQHCDSNRDCRSRICVRPVFCDDIQVVPVGSGVQSARTVVVAPGPVGYHLGHLATAPRPGDTLFVSGAQTEKGDSRVVGDDTSLVGLNERASLASGVDYQCVDGSRFVSTNAGDLAKLPLRFPMCGVIKPGPNGLIESQPGPDDVLVPGGSGQRREWSDPLNPDSDRDFVQDGNERLLGSSPNDPGDTGQSGDRDKDGLSDNQETAGWFANFYDGVINGSRSVQSNMYVADTDLDGLPDYAERHLPCVGQVAPIDLTSHECPTDPTSPDTDGDGLSDFDELSPQLLDQLATYGKYFTGFVLVSDDSKAYGTDPVSADTDQDGLRDSIELLTTYSVLLPDGSYRQTRSNPVLYDTDGDGLSDGAERNYAAGGIDASDADTDDDGRPDGLDAANGFSPKVPDLGITMRFERIDILKLYEGGSEAEIGFWLLARSQVLSTNPTLVASARNASTTAFSHANTGPNGCEMIKSNSPQGTVQLGRQVSFVLRSGQYFSLEGVIAEFNDESEDCGDPPEYVPSKYHAQGCHYRFNRAFNFSELSGNTKGEAMDFDALESATADTERCEFQLRTRIIVN